jgi:hypothetical protein
MAQARRKFDEDFKQGAVRLVRETGKPSAQRSARFASRIATARRRIS